MRSVALFLASAGYSGYIPVAPGTAGSVVGLCLLVGLRTFAPPFIEILVFFLVIIGGTVVATASERHYGEKDPSIVVIDEVAGMYVTLLWFPISFGSAVIAFVAFRCFDILKPFPIRTVERLPRGWGVMADDLIAGCYARVVLQLIALSFPSLVGL